MTDKQFVGIIIGFVAMAVSMVGATVISALIYNSRLNDLIKEARSNTIRAALELDNRITRVER
jgi:hypothetical protein